MISLHYSWIASRASFELGERLSSPLDSDKGCIHSDGPVNSCGFVVPQAASSAIKVVLDTFLEQSQVSIHPQHTGNDISGQNAAVLSM